MAMARNYKQGIYTPKNPGKYSGDFKNIIFRSSWEQRMFRWCDLNPNVLEWNSEEIVVPYFFELDGKYHRYYVDLKIKLKTKDGSVKTYLVEIKPHAQIIKPIVEGKLNKSKKEAIETWCKNQKKWQAASEFAKQRGWEFLVLSERDLGIKF